MLYIAMKTGMGLELHVGQEKLMREIINPAEVKSIQADGDELEYIKNSFCNIPYHKTKRVQKWEDELARFIIRNW